MAASFGGGVLFELNKQYKEYASEQITLKSEKQKVVKVLKDYEVLNDYEKYKTIVNTLIELTMEAKKLDFYQNVAEERLKRKKQISG